MQLRRTSYYVVLRTTTYSSRDLAKSGLGLAEAGVVCEVCRDVEVWCVKLRNETKAKRRPIKPYSCCRCSACGVPDHGTRFYMGRVWR